MGEGREGEGGGTLKKKRKWRNPKKRNSRETSVDFEKGGTELGELQKTGRPNVKQNRKGIQKDAKGGGPFWEKGSADQEEFGQRGRREKTTQKDKGGVGKTVGYRGGLRGT